MKSSYASFRCCQSIKTVSYTHLGLGFAGRGRRGIVLSGKLRHGKGQELCQIPVSYTHLDVYKRQILDGVFNHCGSFHKWLDREKLYEQQGGYAPGAYVSGESPYRDFFAFQNQEAWPDNGSCLLYTSCTESSWKNYQFCAHLSVDRCYNNNRKNPPIHYIVFATPHSKNTFSQKTV